MKRMIGGLAFASALAGSLVFGSATSAQVPAQVPSTLKMVAAPMTVAPGGRVTVSSVNPCPNNAAWAVWSLGPGSPGGQAATNADGSWRVTFTAPSSAGVVPFFASCALAPNKEVVAMYTQVNITVATSARPRFTG